MMRLLKKPMVTWDRMVARMDRERLSTLPRVLDATAERAARLSAYMECRADGGDHRAAVKAQNRAAARVRKALGFTMDSPITF